MGYFHVASGTFVAPSDTEPRLATVEALEHAQDGQLFARWDYCFRWTSDCARPSKLEALKKVGDPVADRVCQVLGLRPHQDGWAALEQYTESTPSDQWDEAIEQFHQQMWTSHPDFDSILHRNVKTGDSKPPIPSYPNKSPASKLSDERIHMGQSVFQRSAFEVLSSLMHYSLTLGFSSSQLTSTLEETGYLTGKQKEVTWRRLIETTQFVVDACSGELVPGGVGWKSCLRVRLLHAQVRLRILEGRGRMKRYDPEAEGVPINQAFLLATLGSFCVAPIWSMRRVGTRLPREDEEAFVGLWQRIGFFMGVDPALLARHFGSLQKAESYFACAVSHLFSDLKPLQDNEKNPSIQILRAVAERPPAFTPVSSLAEVTRLYAGDPLADYLALPRASLHRRTWIRLNIAAQNMLALFGRFYPRRGWAEERQRLTLSAIESIVQWQLGYRRTRFAAKNEADNTHKDSEAEFEASTALFGLDAARWMKRRWRALLVEAFAVVTLCGVMGLYASYLGFRQFSESVAAYA